MRHRLGLFILFASFFGFFLFIVDVRADYVINDFGPLLFGLAALFLGAWLWITTPRPPAEEKPPARFRTLRSLMGGKPKKK